MSLLVSLPGKKTKRKHHSHKSRGESEDQRRAHTPPGKDFVLVHLSHQAPRRVRHGKDNRGCLDPPVVCALDKAFPAQHRHDRRVIGAVERNAQLERRIRPVARIVQK